MSKGLGKRQRQILEALENKEVVIIDDLTPSLGYYIENYHECWLEQAVSDGEALRRAARTLAKRGLIEKVRMRKSTGPYKYRYVLAYKRCSSGRSSKGDQAVT